MLAKQIKRKRRHLRVRARINGVSERPRLCVFRSNQHITAQLIDDTCGKTLLTASDLKLEGKEKQTKTERARIVGKLIAKQAKAKKIDSIVFDRGGYRYHGRVKALAEGAREGGLKF